MSSFALMRKNQRIMLAVFGIAIMFVFMVGDYLQKERKAGAGAGRNEADTSVSWKGGTITQAELQQGFMAHRYASGYLQVLLQKTLAAKGTPRVPDITIQNSEIIPARSVNDILQIKLVSAKAHEMGVITNDKVVFDFLDKLTDGTLSRAEYSTTLDEVLGKGRAQQMSRQQIFDQLKVEITAKNMLALLSRGMGVATPTVSWNSFNRLNRRVRAEVLPVRIEDYVKEVKAEPKTSDLKALYEKYKNFEPNPNFPTPGFRQPQQIAFGFFKVDFDQFLKEEVAKVTEEEIQKEYDLEVSQGKFKVQELPPAAPEKPAAEEKKEETTPDSEKKDPAKPETPKTEGKPDEKKPDAAPPATTPEPPKSDEKKPETEVKKPAETPKAEPAKEEKKLEPKSDVKEEKKKEGTSQLENRSSAKAAEFFVAAVDEKNADPAKSDSKTETKKEAPAADTEKKETPAENKDKEKTDPATKTPADTKTEPDVKKPDEKKKDDAEKGTDKKEEEKKTEEPAKPKFKPLSEVREEVAQRIAKPLAQKKQNKIIAQIKSEIEKWGSNRRRREASKDETDPVPEYKLDFESLAKELNVSYGVTSPMSYFDSLESELGKNDQLFSQKAFGAQIPLYKPQEPEFKISDTVYVWWKDKETAGKVLDFKDAEPQVVAAWKKTEARKLAKKAAEDKADEVKGKETLKSVFGDSVLETNAFSWMTPGNMAFGMAPPRPSAVENVDAPGPEFMEKVFSLKEGEVGTALNETQTTFYVIQVKDDVSKESERRERFLESSNNFALRMLNSQESTTVFRDWFRELGKEMKLSDLNEMANSNDDDE